MKPSCASYPCPIELPAVLQAAHKRLREAGGRSLLVGGAPRDALLGRAPEDFDTEVYGLRLEEVAAALAPLGRSDLAGKAYCVVKLFAGGSTFDFGIPRRERKAGVGHRGFAVDGDPQLDEREAAARRDFTVNALLYDPESREVLDHFGGKEDLERGLLRRVGPGFPEDPLRVLRGLQLAGRYGLRLESETAALCRSMRREFWSLPRERIWGEWRKWAARSTKPALGLEALEQSGWLPFFAELNALVNLPQEPQWHPEGDVWTHTRLCLEALVGLPAWASRSEGERIVISLATLCHDLGKARRARYAPKAGRLAWISPGHDAAGRWLAEALLRRLGAPRSVSEPVQKLVGWHHFLNSFPPSGPTPSALRRLARRLEPATLEQLGAVMRADHLGRPPLVSPKQQKRLDRFDQMAEELAIARQAPRPILKGRHLIERGLKPGPSFKPLLEEAYERQLDGAFEDETGARAWLERRLAGGAEDA